MLDVSFFLLGLNVNSTLVDDPGGLPAGAIAFADFKNGTYHYGGNALSDFLTQDTDWGNFDPAGVVSGIGVYRASGKSYPVLASALGAQLIADGFTAVCTYSGGSLNFDVLDLPTYDAGVYSQAGIDMASTLVSIVSTVNYASDPGDTMHIVAFTYTTGNGSLCVDGGQVITTSGAAPNLNTVAFGGADVLSRIVFYPAKLDAALPALCALDTASLPANTVAPAITGTAQDGQTLTCSAGTFSNSGVVYLQQWSRPDGTMIGTGPTYICQTADVGAGVTCDVFAANDTGFTHFGVSSDPVIAA